MQQEQLIQAIRQSHQDSQGRYGSPRIYEDLIHHSDRGVQYASADYRQMLQTHDIQLSMSRVGDCYDNAAMESFWGTLKTELVYQREYETLEQARQSIFE